MFSATQSITPLNDYTNTLQVQQIERPRSIEAKPACWSQNLIADLQPERFIALAQSFYEYENYALENSTISNGYTILDFQDKHNSNTTLLAAIATQTQSIDITLVKEFCEQADIENSVKTVFITQGVFSSGALDYCARKPVSLISNRELLSIILKLDAQQQNTLLSQATSS